MHFKIYKQPAPQLLYASLSTPCGCCCLRHSCLSLLPMRTCVPLLHPRTQAAEDPAPLSSGLSIHPLAPAANAAALASSLQYISPVHHHHHLPLLLDHALPQHKEPTRQHEGIQGANAAARGANAADQMGNAKRLQCSDLAELPSTSRPAPVCVPDTQVRAKVEAAKRRLEEERAVRARGGGGEEDEDEEAAAAALAGILRASLGMDRCEAGAAGGGHGA